MVGAGPGDPDLLTVKASRLLSQCDALVYDALVPKEIIQLVKKECKCIYIGKRRGHHSTPQLMTNNLLFELAQKYYNFIKKRTLTKNHEGRKKLKFKL